MSEAVMPPGWPAMSIAQAHALLAQPGAITEVVEETIRGVRIKTWKNQPPTLRAVCELAKGHGQKVFMVYEDERVTYDAFHRAVAAFAIALQAQGVTKGDRVAVIMRNVPEWAVAFYAAASIGAIVTPLNAWWTGSELEYGLTDSGSKVAVMDAERYARIAEHLPNCPDLTRVYVSRSVDEIAHPDVTKLESVIGAPDTWAGLPDRPIPPVDMHTDDDATIFYTSGTTGKPKGVELSHRNIIEDLRGANELYMKYDNMIAEGPQVSLAFLPWAHVFGMTCELHQLNSTGGLWV
jgi:long-chain acyl-CoA synthetase